MKDICIHNILQEKVYPRNFHWITQIVLAFLFLLLVSCGGGNAGKEVPGNKELWQKLEDVNKILAEYEREDIVDFISRRGWQMEETGSGLWFQVHEKGSGPKVVTGNVVTLDYNIMLLDGQVVYSSETHDKKVFVVGRGGVEAGLEEGILMLRQGDKARFVMPPHLAHGFHGDGEKIPRRATIVYELELTSIK